MEGFVVDRVEIDAGVVAVESKSGSAWEALFDSLREFNIESAVYNRQPAGVTVIVRIPSEIPPRSFVKQLRDKIRTECGPHLELLWRTDFCLVTVHGLFLSGKDGPARDLTRSLADEGINIEYQVLNPASYSIVIAQRQLRRVVTILTRRLKIRDSAFSIREPTRLARTAIAMTPA